MIAGTEHQTHDDSSLFVIGDAIGQSIARRLMAAETDPDEVGAAISRELDNSRRFFRGRGASERDVETVTDRIRGAIIAEGLRVPGAIEPVGGHA